MAFIDELRAEGHAVESVCRVLRDQGLQIAARPYRAWCQPARPVAARTVTDALVEANVNGQQDLPGGGHEESPGPVVGSPRARPWVLPGGGRVVPRFSWTVGSPPFR